MGRELGGEPDLVRRLRSGKLEMYCAALYELYLSPEADPSKLERWREAPAHSPDRCKASAYERAISTLLLWEGMRRPTPGGPAGAGR